MKVNNVEFIRSAASDKDFPNDNLRRVVFGGRSNVGKSSAINSLTDRKGFARVSSNPGKTVFVNLFKIDTRAWLVDLPGYGYSKTSKQERDRYSTLIESYLDHDIDNITRFYLIVDIRHKPTADDITMVNWTKIAKLRLTVIANKSDKLKPSEIEPSIELIRKTLQLSSDTSIVPFSAEKHTNRDVIVKNIINDLEERENG